MLSKDPAVQPLCPSRVTWSRGHRNAPRWRLTLRRWRLRAAGGCRAGLGPARALLPVPARGLLPAADPATPTRGGPQRSPLLPAHTAAATGPGRGEASGQEGDKSESLGLQRRPPAAAAGEGLARRRRGQRGRPALPVPAALCLRGPQQLPLAAGLVVPLAPPRIEMASPPCASAGVTGQCGYESDSVSSGAAAGVWPGGNGAEGRPGLEFLERRS